MAQGGLKRKQCSNFTLPSKFKRSKSSCKSKGPRKGGAYIAPKKASLVKAQKLKKDLQKAIGQKIEKEAIQKAVSKGQNLRLVAAGLPQDQSKEGSSNSSQH